MNGVEILNNINFHDGCITNFEIKDKNIEFNFIDGFEENKNFKISLNNVEVFIQKYKEEIINYTIDRLLNVNNEEFYVLAGKYTIDNNKYIIKIWIDYPLNDLSNINEYNNNLDNINIQISDDYDDYGQIFIKFITDDIHVEEKNNIL